MNNALRSLLVLLVFGIGVYAYRDDIGESASVLSRTYLPCRFPIAYSLGTIDERFGMSQAEFIGMIKKAETLWEDAIGKELFIFRPDGGLAVNLIYDRRQLATESLRALGDSLDESRASYETLKSDYESRKASYESTRARYDALATSFTERQEEYNARVAAADRRGGAKREEYDALMSERTALETDAAELNRMAAELNAQGKELNILVAAINRRISTLNLDVKRYNEIGATLSEEFDEGLYRSDETGERIDIYQFDDETALVRVLAHEFGHALQLEHVEDPEAIMYRLNQGRTAELSEADRLALRALCGTK